MRCASGVANACVGWLPEPWRSKPVFATSPAARGLNKRATISGLQVLGGWLIAGARLAIASDRDDKPDSVALWAALEDARITLEAGLITGEQRGTPVFAGFDFEDGDLVLVICVATDGGFEQVLIDPDTAAILSPSPISAADDRADATARKAAMDKAARSLVLVLRETLRDNIGAQAVDVTPELQNGHPVAVVTLLNDKQFVKVSRWLEQEFQ